MKKKPSPYEYTEAAISKHISKWRMKYLVTDDRIWRVLVAALEEPAKQIAPKLVSALASSGLHFTLISYEKDS